MENVVSFKGGPVKLPEPPKVEASSEERLKQTAAAFLELAQDTAKRIESGELETTLIITKHPTMAGTMMTFGKCDTTHVIGLMTMMTTLAIDSSLYPEDEDDDVE